MDEQQKSNTPLIIGIIVVVLVALGIWYFMQQQNMPASSTQTAQTDTTNTNTQTPDTTGGGNPVAGNPSPTGAPMSAQVMYTSTGFSPATVTIAKGGTVTFVDQSGNPMWVASNPHPIHNGYSGTTVAQHCPDTADIAFDQCHTGNTYTFTFLKAGTWGYHNHAQHSDTGTVIVQ